MPNSLLLMAKHAHGHQPEIESGLVEKIPKLLMMMFIKLRELHMVLVQIE